MTTLDDLCPLDGEPLSIHMEQDRRTCARRLADRETTVVRTGSQALLVYRSGDCDWVTVMSLDRTGASVRTPRGDFLVVCLEDIGIGVDDSIVPVYDDERLSIPDSDCPVDVASDYRTFEAGGFSVTHSYGTERHVYDTFVGKAVLTFDGPFAQKLAELAVSRLAEAADEGAVTYEAARGELAELADMSLLAARERRAAAAVGYGSDRAASIERALREALRAERV